MALTERQPDLVVDTSKAEKPELLRSYALSLGFNSFLSQCEDKGSSKGPSLSVVCGSNERILQVLSLSSAEDVARAVSLVAGGQRCLLVEVRDWKVIPLENLLAELQRAGGRIYARAGSPEEIATMAGILEKGIDGIVISPSKPEELRLYKEYLSSVKHLSLSVAKVESVSRVGLGDRVCVDTASMLRPGQGMLVGGSSSFLFLVNSETLENPFVATRPFRVNAGAVSNYVVLPDGRTKYLSELSSGDRVLVTDCEGKPRVCVVGRVKIESRPLLMIKASSDKGSGFVLVQDAETITLLGPGGQPLSATGLKAGDRIVAMESEQTARHFGIAVREYVVEK